MSSNPLIMGYGGGDFTAAGCPGGGRAAALSLCVQAVSWRLDTRPCQILDPPLLGVLFGTNNGWFSDDSALEVCIHETRYTNRRSYLFTFFKGTIGPGRRYDVITVSSACT